MDFSKYQQLASRTINHKLTNNEMMMHALHGIAGESGEIHSIFQKRYQGHPLDPEHLRSELGDLLWFAAELATACNWDMTEVAQGNIAKLIKRYPQGFTEAESLHRKEGDI